MKKYTKLIVEITEICDVISTSENVTTGGVKIPWSTSEVSPSAYQPLRFTYQGHPNGNSYET